MLYVNIPLFSNFVNVTFVILHNKSFSFFDKKKQIQQAVRSIRMSEFADIRLSVSVGGVCGVHPITEAIRKADCLMYLDKAEQQP